MVANRVPHQAQSATRRSRVRSSVVVDIAASLLGSSVGLRSHIPYGSFAGRPRSANVVPPAAVASRRSASTYGSALSTLTATASLGGVRHAREIAVRGHRDRGSAQWQTRVIGMWPTPTAMGSDGSDGSRPTSSAISHEALPESVGDPNCPTRLPVGCSFEQAAKCASARSSTSSMSSPRSRASGSRNSA